MSVVDAFTINKTGEGAPEPQTATLIAGNTNWKYNDTNTNQGTAWRAENFDDSAWKTGKGPLGYPASDSNSTFGPINSGALLDNRSNPNAYITYYFRKTFDITAEDLAKITGLTLTVGIDDGYVLYINGVEARRLYMPAGEIDWQTWATYVNEPSSAEGTDTADITVAALSLLKSGTNTVAVEVHNRDNTSSDIYFDMRLVAQLGGTAPAPTAEIKNIAITVGADETERNITWYGDSAQAGKVQIALRSTMTSDAFPAAYTEFAATRTASSVAGFSTFKASLIGAEPNTEYVYRVGNDDAWSDVYTFKTSPAGDFSFLAAGDPQIGSSGNVGNDTAGWTTTLNKAKRLFPDVSLLISLGDQVETSPVESQYDGFLAPEYLRSLTLAPNIGNHDTGAGGGIYKEHFTVPNSSETYGVTVSGGDYWYAHNDVLFLSINSNDMSTAEHKAFLQEAIAAYKAQNGGEDPLWKIVTFHHSIYSSASHTTDTDIRARRNELSPVFAELDIDAVLAGHDHVYTRSYMMGGTTGMTPITEGYDGANYAAYTKTQPGETVYITANSASGSKFYALKQTDFPFVAKENQENIPNLTRVDVTADALTFTTYRTGANNAANGVVDAFTLRKASATTPPDDGTVSAEIRGSAAVVKGAPVSYTVSLSNLKNVGVVTLGVTASGAHLDLKDVTALNGFTALNGIVWESLGNDMWKGTVILAYTAGGGLLSAEGPLDVVTISGAAHNVVAETTVTLTDIQVTGNVNGASGALPSEIKTAEATTSVTEAQAVYSPYDLNRDGAINALDLTIAVYYYLASGADPDWESVKFDVASAKDADVNGDDIVNLADLIEILANYQASYNLWP
jgi:3',5'-cyclic AMP phosphodiesterase CpdA